MDQRSALSRRKLLHTLAGTGVIAAADLAWWDAPYIGARKAWGAEPVRFQWSVPEPTRIALINSLVERFNQSQKDFAVQVEYVPQAQARQKLISAIAAGGCVAWLVYRYLGLKFVSRSWFNLDTAWAVSLILVGAIALVLSLTG